MMGLAYLVFFGVYALISVAVVTWAVRHARAERKNPKRWGCGAALVMWLIPFWDWIPTVAMHQYYCATEAGFWVYKTPEQWMKENPGVMERLVASKKVPSRDEKFDEGLGTTTTYFLNDRFNWLIKRQGPSFPNRWRQEQEVVDAKTGEVLARYINFSTAQGVYGGGWYGWKLWLHSEHCLGGGQNQDELRNFRNNFVGAEK